MCYGNTGLNKESNFDGESINRNVISNDNIHDRDSLYARPAKLDMLQNVRNKVRKNHRWNTMLKKQGSLQLMVDLVTCLVLYVMRNVHVYLR